MKVRIDTDRCEGHAKCQSHAPEVFQVGDDDKAMVLIPSPPEELWVKVRAAERLCPRQAVIIEEE